MKKIVITLLALSLVFNSLEQWLIYWFEEKIQIQHSSIKENFTQQIKKDLSKKSNLKTLNQLRDETFKQDVYSGSIHADWLIQNLWQKQDSKIKFYYESFDEKIYFKTNWVEFSSNKPKVNLWESKQLLNEILYVEWFSLEDLSSNLTWNSFFDSQKTFRFNRLKSWEKIFEINSYEVDDEKIWKIKSYFMDVKKKFWKYSDNVDYAYMIEKFLNKDDSLDYSISYVWWNLNNIFSQDLLSSKTNVINMEKNKISQTFSWLQNYSKIKYDNVYSWIDLIYKKTNQWIKSEFIVSPFVDSRVIKIKYEWVDSIGIDKKWNLILTKKDQSKIEKAPYSYQIIDGYIKPVSTKYKILSSNEIWFELWDYDTNFELIIDPLVVEFQKYISSDLYLYSFNLDANWNSYFVFAWNWNILIKKFNKDWDILLTSVLSAWSNDCWTSRVILDKKWNLIMDYYSQVMYWWANSVIYLNVLVLDSNLKSIDGFDVWAGSTSASWYKTFHVLDFDVDDNNNLWYIVREINQKNQYNMSSLVTYKHSVYKRTDKISKLLSSYIWTSSSSNSSYENKTNDIQSLIIKNWFTYMLMSSSISSNLSWSISNSKIYSIDSTWSQTLLYDTIKLWKSCNINDFLVDKFNNLYVSYYCFNSENNMMNDSSWISKIDKSWIISSKVSYKSITYPWDSILNIRYNINDIAIDSTGNLYFVENKHSSTLNNWKNNYSTQLSIKKIDIRNSLSTIYSKTWAGYSYPNDYENNWYTFWKLIFDWNDNLITTIFNNYSNNNSSSSNMNLVIIGKLNQIQTISLADDYLYNSQNMYDKNILFSDSDWNIYKVIRSPQSNTYSLIKVYDNNVFRLKSSNITENFEEDEIVLEFSKTIDPKTLWNIKLYDKNSIPVKLTYSSFDNVVKLKINQKLLGNEQYNLIIWKWFKDAFWINIISQKNIYFVASLQKPIRINRDVLDNNSKIFGENEKSLPIDLRLWSFKFEKTIDKYAGSIMPFEFDLYYNSLNSSSILWKWFSFNYNIKLEVFSSNKVKFVNYDGSYEYFNLQNWKYISEPWSRKKLVKDLFLWIFKLIWDWKIYEFDGKWNLLRIVDDSWNFVRFDHDMSWRLIQLSDTNNDIFIFNYSTGWLLSNVLRPDGTRILFTYESLVSSWNNYNLLKSYKNEKRVWGFWVGMSFEYQWTLVSKIINEDGNVLWKVAYSDANKVLSLENGDWNINSFEYVMLGDLINIDNVIWKDWRGVLNYYKFDVKWNLIQKYINYGSSVVWKYLYSYDAIWLLKTERLPRWNWYKYSYDDSWNLVEKRFKTLISASDDEQADLVERYVYEPVWNRLYKTISPQGFGEINQINYLDTTLDEISWRYGFDKQELKILLTQRWIFYNLNWWWKVDLNIKERKVFDEKWTVKYTKWVFNYNSNWSLLSSVVNNNEISLYTYDNKSRIKYIQKWFLRYEYSYDERWNLEKISIQYDDGVIVQTLLSQINLYNGFWQKVVEKSLQWVIKKYFYTQSWLLMRSCFAKLQSWDEMDENNYICEDYTTENQYFPSWKLKTISQNYSNWTIKKIVKNFSYDEGWNLASQSISWVNLITYSYDAAWNLISKNDNWHVYNYKYDLNKNLIQSIDFRKRVTAYKYNLYDRLERQTNPEWVYYSYFYDKNSRKIGQEIYAKDSSLLNKTQTDYCDYNVVWEIQFDVKDFTKKIQKIYEYANWLMIKSVNSRWWVVQYWYDEFWNVNQIIENSTKINMKFIWKDLLKVKELYLWNELISRFEYVYDQDLRQIEEKITDIKLNKISLTKKFYNRYNQLVQQINPKNISTYFEYDINSNVVKKTIDWKNADGIQLLMSQQFGYDEKWNQLYCIDANWNKTLFTYDVHNRVLSQNFQDGTKIINTYDDVLWKKIGVLQDWTVVTEFYDKMDRIYKRNIKSSWVNNTQSFVYDGMWRFISWTDLYTEVKFSYDWFGKLSTESQFLKAKNSLYTINYEINDLFKKITYPSWKVVTYNYDIFHNLANIYYNDEKIAENTYMWNRKLSTVYGNHIVSNFEYSWLWNVTKIDFVWKKVITNEYDNMWFKSSSMNWNEMLLYTYDDFDRVDKIFYRKDSSTYKNQKNYYDLVSNRKRFEEQYLIDWNYETVFEQYYQINNMNQYATIMTNSYEKTLKYSLNSYKNTNSEKQSQVLQNSKLKWTAKESTQQLDSYKLLEIPPTKSTNQTQNYIYDKKWNLIFDGKNNYKFDYKNRLISRNWEGIVYDVLWRRLQVWNIIYVVNIDDQVLEQRWADTKVYIWWVKQDELIMMEKNSQEKIYYHQDEQNSVVLITNMAGDILQNYIYDAYWNVYLQNSDWTVSKITYDFNQLNDYYYQWKRFEGDFYYRQARYYSPLLWRFISVDPIWVEDDINLYSFVRNNPWTYTDPSWNYLENWWDALCITSDFYNLLWNTVNVFADATIYGIGFSKSDEYLKNQAFDMLDRDFEERWEIMWNLWFDVVAFIIPSMMAWLNRVKKFDNNLDYFLTNKYLISTKEYEKTIAKYWLDAYWYWNKSLLPKLWKNAKKYHKIMLNEVTRINKISNWTKDAFIKKYNSFKQFLSDSFR